MVYINSWDEFVERSIQLFRADPDSVCSVSLPLLVLGFLFIIDSLHLKFCLVAEKNPVKRTVCILRVMTYSVSLPIRYVDAVCHEVQTL